MGIKTQINGFRMVISCGDEDLFIDAEKFTRDIWDYAVMHGLKQKICDAAALGAGSTDAEKMEAMRAVFDQLSDGEWNRRMAGDGTPAGLLARALMEAAELSADDAEAAVAAMDKKTQAAMRSDPTLAPIIARLKAADDAKRPAPKVDAQSLLAELRAA